jgi:hypothetical protein
LENVINAASETGDIFLNSISKFATTLANTLATTLNSADLYALEKLIVLQYNKDEFIRKTKEILQTIDAKEMQKYELQIRSIIKLSNNIESENINEFYKESAQILKEINDRNILVNIFLILASINTDNKKDPVIQVVKISKHILTFLLWDFDKNKLIELLQNHQNTITSNNDNPNKEEELLKTIQYYIKFNPELLKTITEEFIRDKGTKNLNRGWMRYAFLSWTRSTVKRKEQFNTAADLKKALNSIPNYIKNDFEFNEWWTKFKKYIKCEMPQSWNSSTNTNKTYPNKGGKKTKKNRKLHIRPSNKSRNRKVKRS